MPARDFDSIYADCSRMVYWAAYGVMRAEADALDVSQAVFLKVFEHLGELSSMNDAQLRGWLYRVTVNQCLDGKRRQKRVVLTAEFAERESEDAFDLPEPAAIAQEQRQALRQAIDALPDLYREPVLLHYFSGLGYEEIAALSGTTEGTIKSRMSRAKQRLYALLKGGERIG